MLRAWDPTDQRELLNAMRESYQKLLTEPVHLGLDCVVALCVFAGLVGWPAAVASMGYLAASKDWEALATRIVDDHSRGVPIFRGGNIQD